LYDLVIELFAAATLIEALITQRFLHPNQRGVAQVHTLGWVVPFLAGHGLEILIAL
jgi:hypothetical protein